MGLLDTLFGGGEKTTTTTVDPYENMPKWQQDYYKKEAANASANIDDGRSVAAHLAENPQEYNDLSKLETKGLDKLQGAGKKAAGIGDKAVDVASGQAGKADKRTMAALGETTDYADMAGIDDLYGKHENAYTDDVVDSTLAQMDRDQMRKQAERGASAASVGGLNSTRAAVADALGEQLGRMDKAQMEATLRSDAFDKSRELGQDEFKIGLDRDEKQNELQFDKADTYKDLANLGLDEGKTLDDMATSKLDRQKTVYDAETQQGATQRQINDLNREAERTAGRDAMSWFGDFSQGNKGITAPTVTQQTSTQDGGGGGLVSDIVGAAGTVASIYAMSDRRMKTDVKKQAPDAGLEALDKLHDMPAYDYRYRDDAPVESDGGLTSGLMAQDVEQAGIEGGVQEDENGMKFVDPYPILATVVQAVRELDRRTRSLA